MKQFANKHGWWLAIIVAVISASGGWIAPYFKYKATIAEQKTALMMAEAELHSEARGLDFADYMQEWGETEKMIQRLFDETNIDRFLLLRAWNGTLSPRWATATMQLRKSGQQAYSYVHVDLDSDYQGRMQEIMRRNYAVWDVEDMPDSLIKSIYQNEGVTAAMWALIDTKKDSAGRAVHTYISFATRSGQIDDRAATRAALIVGRLRGMSRNFYGGVNE